MQLIKGESSHWVNKNGLTKKKFEWQSEYLNDLANELLKEVLAIYHYDPGKEVYVREDLL